jgi:uncharacterized membrane protein YfcA
MTLAALVAIVLLAFTTEAAIGFGSTVITVAIGAQFVPIDRLLPAFVPVNIVLSSWIVLRHRRDVQGRLLALRFLPWMALGIVPGMALFRLQNTELLGLGFALFVVALSALELRAILRADRGAAATPLKLPAAAGLLTLGGFIHGLFGSGGPMVVYVASRAALDKSAFRATLSALWLVLNAALVANFATLHRLDRQSATLSAVLLAPMLLALRLGAWLHTRITPDRFRVAIYVLLLLAGGALAARSV